MKFIHRVSKGSRFNQIYVPAEMRMTFEVGDLVEVRLIEKKSRVYYYENIKDLGDFKRKIIEEIFSVIKDFNNIEQAFIVGSFLTSREDYNDIDVIIVGKNAEEEVCSALTEKLQLKFHIIAVPEEKFERLIKVCPVTRSMLYYYASNKKFSLSQNTSLDKNHLKFLLMMPEDLLEIRVKSRAYYDSIRRLIAIELFLLEKDSDPLKINKEISRILGKRVFSYLKRGEEISDAMLKEVREIIRSKLDKINNLIDAK